MRKYLRKNRFFKILILLFTILYFTVLPVYTQTQNKAEVKELTSEAQVITDENTNEVTQSNLFSADDGAFKPERGSSLYYTVKQGGLLMIFIILLGILVLTLIIERLIYFTKNKIWNNKNIEKYLKQASEKSGSVYCEDMEDDLKKAFQIYSNRLESGLSLISGIGHLSPIVGFMGTVIGMINAFASIAVATTVNAKVVAVGIQIALVTTAGGLIVAAPSLTFFYLFTHIIQKRYAQSEEIINEICEKLPKLSGKIK